MVNSNFNDYLIDKWELDNGLNFAISLAKLTDWIINLDSFELEIDGKISFKILCCK